jgi:hypothetical protein
MDSGRAAAVVALLRGMHGGFKTGVAATARRRYSVVTEAKIHPFTGGLKPTTGELSTLVATVRFSCETPVGHR